MKLENTISKKAISFICYTSSTPYNRQQLCDYFLIFDIASLTSYSFLMFSLSKEYLPSTESIHITSSVFVKQDNKVENED
jgi:hypothetical protein